MLTHPMRPPKRDREGKVHPFTTYIMLEAERFNSLRETVLGHLQELRRVIRGEVLMTEFLETVYANLVFGKVPKAWVDSSYPTLKPLGSWVSDLKRRIEFVTQWLERGHGLGNESAGATSTVAPLQSYWLGGLFFPQGFLTAVLQAHARLFNVPIDSLTFETTVTTKLSASTVEAGPKEGVYVHGLFIDGAKWYVRLVAL